MLNLEISTEEFSSKLSKLAYCSVAYGAMIKSKRGW